MINFHKQFTLLALVLLSYSTYAQEIIHDAEYYIIESQNAEKWNAEDQALEKRLAELKKKHGTTPYIVYILWDDQPYGSVGFPHLQKNMGYETPNINRLADE